MDDIDSLFDAGMRVADDAIRRVFGVTATLIINGQPVDVLGDFYDPHASAHLPGSAAILDGTLPTLFVKLSDIAGLKQRDIVIIQQRDRDTEQIRDREFWVVRIGPPDSGSCHLSLNEGSPPADARYQG